MVTGQNMARGSLSWDRIGHGREDFKKKSVTMSGCSGEGAACKMHAGRLYRDRMPIFILCSCALKAPCA
jgi:hypothetical protein